MRQYVDKGGVSGALLTNLSKASDCVLHDLLISKLEFYANVVEIPLKQKTKNKNFARSPTRLYIRVAAI